MTTLLSPLINLLRLWREAPSMQPEPPKHQEETVKREKIRITLSYRQLITHHTQQHLILRVIDSFFFPLLKLAVTNRKETKTKKVLSRKLRGECVAGF
jgi:hypothetical protein